MTNEELYRVKVVAEDLQYLKETWNQPINDANLRRDSNVLRSLLVHGQFGAAWRAVGYRGEPTVVGEDLNQEIDDARILGANTEGLFYAQVGEANSEGVIVSSLLWFDYVISDRLMADLTGRPKEGRGIQQSLSKYMRSPCIFVNIRNTSRKEYIGLFRLSREEVIKYIANKLGGSHLDTTRKKADPTERKFFVLDELMKEINVAGKPPIYYALLSIGQAVANCADTQIYIERVQQL